MIAIGQFMGSAALMSGGFSALLHSGNPATAVFLLLFLGAGTIVIGSFIITRVLRQIL